VLLLLVIVATFSIVLQFGSQAQSRLCLSRALAHGHLTADRCLAGSVDRASFGGHLYSDKAPGLAVIAIPVVELVQLPSADDWHTYDFRLWTIALLTVGVAFVGSAFLVGRIAEGLAAGWGGATLVTFSLGTLMSSLGAHMFEEVPAAALGFAAFVLAWRRRPLVAGLVAGVAFLTAYQAALTVAVVGLYVALAGVRSLLRYALGVLPSVLLLGAYDWAAFGSPLHLSYRYVAQQFRQEQEKGLFGIGVPNLHAIRVVLIGDRGLLIDAPVLALAALGLLYLWRRGYVAEAAAAALMTLAYLMVEFGYFDPYGGDSPGPRFFIPAIPFLALGLAPAFAARRVLTSVLAVLSVIASAAVALTWPQAVHRGYHEGYRFTIWNQLLQYLKHGHAAAITSWAPRNMLHWLGVKDTVSAAFVILLSLATLAIALRDGWSGRVSASPRRSS
jgi:hypothetical protein